MRQEVQLYISNTKLDLFQDETISLTSTIQNVKDIAKVFTDYSQSFTVPASKTNNKIFKHYYNNDIVGGFDAQVKIDAHIELNNLPFKEGKLKLDRIQMKNNKAYAYNVTFFGSTVTLKDLLGEDELDSLDWLDNFKTTYSYEAVRDKLSNGEDFTIDSVTYTDAVLTPLISAQDRWYYDSSTTPADDVANLYDDGLSTNLSGINYLDLKYALRLQVIIRAIEEKYGISFRTSDSNDFFRTDNAPFYNLYMWLHREKGRFVTGELNEYLDKMPVNENLSGFYTQGNYFTINDVFSWFGAAQSYTPTLYLELSSSAATFNITLESAYDGVVYDSGDLTGSINYTVNFPALTSNGTYKIKITSDTAIAILGNNSTSETYLKVDRVESVSGATSTDNFEFTADQSMASSFQFIPTDQMPKIKVIDFLTGLFKMFNLTAYYDGEEIVVKTLDDYYSDGTTRDISEYVDISNSEIAPATLYNQITFGYKGVNSYITNKHEELFNIVWAEEKYNAENRFEGVKYEVNIPFGHMKYERLLDDSDSSTTTIQWGWMVDDYKENEDGTFTPSTYVDEPLIFYPIKQSSGTTALRIHSSTTENSRSTYYIPSNSIGITDSQNIHFKAEINEYAYSVFEDTLFKTYYSDYISDLFDASNRITKITAILPVGFLVKYKLNDTLIIKDKQYKINSITTDLTTGRSEIELLNAID